MENLNSVARIRRENLKKICEAFDSQTYVAERLNYDPQRISRLVSNKKDSALRNIGQKVAGHIEKTFSLPQHWLDHEHSISKEELIEYINSENKDQNKIKFELKPMESYLTLPDLKLDFVSQSGIKPNKRTSKMIITDMQKNELESKGINSENAATLIITDDSMLPFLKVSDCVIVDLGKRDVISGSRYAVNIDGDLKVRRLHKIGKTLQVVCDNPNMKQANPDRMIEELASFEIIGKLVWVSASLSD